MDDDKQREIAGEGGQTAHEFTMRETKATGEKGGEALRGGSQDSQEGTSQRGGSRDQHAEAGRQRHGSD